MLDPATGCTLVFNGEIYNYRELREELLSHGHRFHSAGDTEVLLKGYLQWGKTCLDHLNGMFAFALWDPRLRTTFLARDRIGEKPLHLVRHEGALWFSSEIKALLAAGVLAPRANHADLLRFLALGDLGHPTETPFAEVNQLAPGHYLLVDADGNEQTRRYWSLPELQQNGQSAKPGSGVNEELAAMFRSSVALRLRSDVPLGTSLSGGLDSSAVLAAVREHRPADDLHAFTASFPGTSADELDRAQSVAGRLGVTVHPVPLASSDLDAGLEAVLHANEGPVESPSTVAQFFVMREAHRCGITVLLDGQGADETWAGYDKYAGFMVIDRLVTGRIKSAMSFRRAWRDVRGKTPIHPLVQYAALAGGARVRSLLTGLALDRSASWLAPDWRRNHSSDILEDASAAVGSVTEQAMRLDVERVTLPRLLRYADRNSMAWSREVRLPFLDHRIVELACRTSITEKIVHGWTKEPVRRLLEGFGMSEVARRRDKQAYMPPTADWLADPAIDARVRSAWLDLYRAGVLAAPTPSASVVQRWRVLATATWAASYSVSLR